MSIKVGSTISHYKILSEIGKGGMGEVYLAQDKKLGRKVALKLLPDEFSNDSERMHRFVQEAKAVSALNHPNIITIHEIDDFNGMHFIATEYIEGKTLNDFSFGSSISIGTALKIAIQVASALREAHSAGIVHRDIKPDNVMVRPDGYVKVLDFGLAKLTQPIVDSEKSTLFLSTPNVIKGTVAYMSPEQARGLEVDARSDIWSFGIMLYELISHRFPFSGETPTDLLIAIVKSEPEALESIMPDLPSELHSIVGRALRKSLDERYQDIREVVEDLERLKKRLDYEKSEHTISLDEPEAGTERTQRETELLPDVSTKPPVSPASDDSKSTTPNNLSGELSPLIGRGPELEEIVRLVCNPDIRLLTITGVGGTGKTRIAHAAANKLLARFAGGVYFIELSAIRNPELLLPIIGQTLGVQEESGKTLTESIRDNVGDRRILIVLDNFEQITEAAPLIAELLSSSANLKILVTSRVRLILGFEQEFTLQPLAFPEEKNLSVRELLEFPAVALFIARAKSVNRAFELTKENGESVAEICRRLDGLPLAVELAAVRIKLLAPRAILRRLSNRLKLLTGGARDGPDRQKTIRGAIGWSYDLLDKEEKKLLNRLSVFAGGFALDGAEAVGSGETESSVDLLNGVASLVDKSLISQREQSDGEPRFRMLEVVREFMLEALMAEGGANEARNAHASFFCRLAEEAEPELHGASGGEWLERLEQEHDNLRVAIEWALENEPEKALQMVGAVNMFWMVRGHLAEGRKWIEQALERNSEGSDPKLLAKVFGCIGSLSWMHGETDAAKSFFNQSLRLYRDLDDKSGISYALGGLGIVTTIQGDLETAKTLTNEGLTIAREINDKRQISLRLNSLGEISRSEENYKNALKYYEEAREIAIQESFNVYLPVFTANLVMVTCLLEDYESARGYALESLKISEKMGSSIGTGAALCNIAAISVKAGDMNRAAQLFGSANAIYDAVDFKPDQIDQDFFEPYIDEARAAIGEQAFETEFAEGMTMSARKAIALAREAT